MIGQQLLASEHEEIVLEHEYTHITNKDNYWLAIIVVVESIYWWNPVVKILTKEIRQLLEARCDHKASRSFAKNIYQEQLSHLMLLSQLDKNANFNSAVFSKNPDIRRIQYLQEKPTMNLISKISISFLTLMTIALLSVPISSISVLAARSGSQHLTAERFSLDFEVFPMAVASKILGEFFEAKKVIVDPSLSGIVFTNFQVSQIDISELSALTNINWELADGYLNVSPRKGEVISQLMSNEKYAETKVKNELVDNDIGVQLKLVLTHTRLIDGARNTRRKEVTLWSHFNNPFSVDFDETREIHFEIKDSGESALINSKMFTIHSDKSKELIASPKLFTNYGNEATIQIGDISAGDKDVWKMEATPSKTKNIGLEH